MFGFKSFKDRTIISFDQDITAIVGSNGCGKSNVIDAMYWVMGDMSPKHLRGHVMADVIFSGSRDALPLDMAEVCLVLERDPTKDAELPPQFQSSNEIQITRRYYRSGESEYFINKVPCRLRDIQEFFMDTGVGAKAYSIIEQGAISRLVTQKPEDRRLVIEEVAGIMKFKARRAETERKLEHSRMNLTRVDDIVKDLQKQLGSLKRQAEKAEKFRQYSDELRALEIQMGSKEWLVRSDAKNQALLLSGELTQIRDEKETALVRVRNQVEALSQELTGLESDLAAKRALTRSAELALKDIETRIAAADAKKEGHAKRLLQDESALEQLEVRRTELESSLVELDTQIQATESEALRLASELETASVEVESLKEKSETIRETVETVRRQLHAEELEQTRLTQQIQGFQRTLTQLSSREDSLKSQIQNLSSELALRETERQGTLSHLETAFSTRSDLEQSKNSVDERLNELEAQKSELQNERDDVRENLTVTKVRKEQLEALDRDLDGVDAASRALALHMRSQGATEALLADSIKVPALLEKAVEAVLGRNLQRIVARSGEQVADLRRVLETSEDEKARKARSSLWMPELAREKSSSFDLGSIYLADDAPMPIAAASETPAEFTEAPGPDGLVGSVVTTPTVAPVTTAREFLLNHPSVVGPMPGLVKEDGAEEGPEWSHLVRDVWVVRDRESLMELATKLAGVPLTFVSLDGDVLTKEGFLDLAPAESSPGTEGLGLVQRKREIAELKAKEQDLSDKLLMAQERLDGCVRAIAEEKDKFRELTARLAALNPDVERHSVLLRQVEAQLAKLSERETLLTEELARATQEKDELSRKIEEITEQVATAEARKLATKDSLDGSLAELQTSLGLQREAEAKLQGLAQQARKQDQELSELRSSRAAAEQEKTLSAARRQHLEHEIGMIRQDIEALALEIEEARMALETQSGIFEEAKTVEHGAHEAVDSLKAKLYESQRSVQEISTELAQVLDKLRDIDQELAVNDVEIRNLKERIREQYQIALDELDNEKLKELATPADLEIIADAEAAKKHSQMLRTRIENLGKINMVAVEEFEDVSKRHEYLFIQRQDLSDAITQLTDAIERIDRESRHRFAEAFAAVNDAFQKTFPVLFGGGQAELRLTNPDNLLESGVEIVAQPPGKKLQSVTLLSGGEKALTAVSLIFGIFSIKPSPFCVLDEVDAPLDDANVNRFNAQVRRMAETSQIIMITHHKKTMESCDALFGVTMERPGISKIASAKLGELTGA